LVRKIARWLAARLLARAETSLADDAAAIGAKP
jgi:hypothetical protein